MCEGLYSWTVPVATSLSHSAVAHAAHTPVMTACQGIALEHVCWHREVSGVVCCARSAAVSVLVCSTMPAASCCRVAPPSRQWTSASS